MFQGGGFDPTTSYTEGAGALPKSYLNSCSEPLYYIRYFITAVENGTVSLAFLLQYYETILPASWRSRFFYELAEYTRQELVTHTRGERGGRDDELLGNTQTAVC
jgi:hypothetical protein